jgi:hypothetical protein
MFNSHPIIQRVPIGNGAECIVVDNILSDPQRMVADAVAGREAFSFNPANHYPGIEKRMPAEFDQRLEEYFSQHLKQPAKNTLCLWYDGTALRKPPPSTPRPSPTARCSRAPRAVATSPAGKQGDVLTVEFTVAAFPASA